jgi:hypothetical protein
VNQVAEVNQSPAKQVQSPSRAGVLQPRNVVNVQVGILSNFKACGGFDSDWTLGSRCYFFF